MNKIRILTVVITLLLFAPGITIAQADVRAQACFFEQTFENGLPGDWDFGGMVERQTESGVGLGEFVPAWTVGTTAQLNGSSYFPVPNVPNGNAFLMANDDIAPCNCDMDNVIATTPVIDLGGRSQVALSCRAFNEMNLGAGDALIQASTDGVNWDTLLTIAPVQGDWQNIWLDLSGYDGEANFQLRFRWSDGGGWASGFALDDVCMREAFVHDLTVIKAYSHDIAISPFVAGDQSLHYSALPLDQVAPMVVSAEVLNSGSSTEAVIATVTILMDGSVVFSVSPQPIGDLAPGERLIASVETGWVPTEVGTFTVHIDVQPVETDVDLTDNSGSSSVRITGPGWDNGYGVMAADEDAITGQAVGGTDQFVAAVRMEVANSGGTIQGISTALSPSSAVGEEIRAILMDGNLAYLDTSIRHTITQVDIDIANAYGTIYLPLSEPVEREAGDYFAGIQRLSTGNSSYVGIFTSGVRSTGSNALLEGATFDVNYIQETPIVRIHFSEYAVGLDEVDRADDHPLMIFPLPMADQGTIKFQSSGSERTYLNIHDGTGRSIILQDLGIMPAGLNRVDMDVRTLAPGIYTVIISSEHERATGRVIVSR